MIKFNQDTQLRLAGCSAVGLHFSSLHPAVGMVWAVDDARRAHMVRIRQSPYALPTAQHVCSSFGGGECEFLGSPVAFDPETTPADPTLFGGQKERTAPEGGSPDSTNPQDREEIQCPE
jgi:hypothetical protein